MKTAGTSCFMTARTRTFLAALTERCRAAALRVLVEVHAHRRLTLELAASNDLASDFALPPLVLDALHTGDAGPLHGRLGRRPRNVITVLDTHDGIGVIDVGESAGHGAAEHPTTSLDALGGDLDATLPARALPLVLPGTPQPSSVGLLMGRNDEALLARTGVGRDVNRHHFTTSEVSTALASPAVRRLLDLVALRRDHPAFLGEWWLSPHDPRAPGLIETGWRGVGGSEVALRVDAGARAGDAPPRCVVGGRVSDRVAHRAQVSRPDRERRRNRHRV